MIRPKTVIQIFLTLIALTAAAQKKTIKLDANLSQNSTALEAKPKGIGTVTKYQFGDYSIVSGKAGWTTTKTKSRLFSITSESKSKQKLSFVFVGHKKDTVIVNASVDVDFRELNIRNESELLNSNENFVAFLAPADGSLPWQLVCATLSGTAVPGNFEFRGMMTDGQKEIEIHAVYEWSDGKTPTFNIIPGYQFIYEGEAVAAVQGSINTMHKKLVWLRNDLPTEFKLLLAGAAASIFVMIDGQQSRM